MDVSTQELLVYGVVLGAGVVAGFLNTVAGGGSLLTIPALMLLGLPAGVANGTARLAIVSQSIFGVWAFHRQGRLPTAALAPVVTPTVLGAAAGASVAAWAPTDVLEPALLGTMTLMALTMVVKPSLVGAESDEPPRAPLRHWPSLLGLFAAGLYGGFVQAGVGFVLLAVLGGLSRFDLVRANALKLACTLVFSIPAIVIFAFADRIAWVPAAVLAVGTVVGSQLGVRFAVKVSGKVLRLLILAMVVATSVAALLR
jgi:uncharacterized membrane protein YfcA